MDNILFCGYRDWSHKLFLEVENTIIDYFSGYVDDKELLNKMIEEYEPKVIYLSVNRNKSVCDADFEICRKTANATQ